MVHAKYFSPSSAHRWMACPASAKLNADTEETFSPAANEGTAAHELAETVLKTVRGKCSKYVGQVLLPDSPEPVEVDNDMASYVQTYVDYVRAIRKESAGVLSVEVECDFTDWIDEGFGTSDAVIYSKRDKTLHVIDLKYGKGVKVFAEGNEQGQLYALGAYNLYRILGNGIERVVIHIIQPRLDHIDTWEISVDDLLKFGERASVASEKCMEENPQRVAGEKQCKFCKVSDTCPALKRYVEKVIGSEFDNLDLDDPENITDHQIADIVKNKTFVIGWLDSVEKLAVERLTNGERVEGVKLVEGRSLRKWANEDDATTVLIELLGDDAYAKKILSVAQAEKKLGKDKTKLADLIIKPSGKPTLVLESDKRPALNISFDDFVEV